MQRMLWLVVILVAGCGREGSPAGGVGTGDGSSGGSSSGDGGACSPTLDSIASGLFARSCTTAGCHGSVMAAAALDLSGADLEASLINQPAGTCDGFRLVVPGAPDDSLLVRKLAGEVPTDCGDPMPPVGPPVSAEELSCVRAWIASLNPDAAVGPPACETCGGAACIDLTSDIAHCGACDAACPSGATCSGGACQCPTGLALCGGSCVDLNSDANHCGKCDAACGTGALCNGGSCACGTGFAACMSGCTELASDPLNCGACEVECGAGKLCTPTGCGTQAACSGLTKCGSACVDTSASLLHCGGCNMPCAAGQTCSGGTCGCPSGTMLCAGTCLDVSSNPTHCGSCENVCPDGTTCTNGACACPGGGSACGTDCVDLLSNPMNCGRCGNVCAPGQTCSSGSCTCAGRTVDFATEVAPVLETNCTNAGCHAGTRAKAELDLTLAKSYAELVGVKTTQCNDGRLLVKPGEPSASYLVQKLLGVNMCSGTQMPKAGTSLPQADLEAVSAWICAGAAK